MTLRAIKLPDDLYIAEALIPAMLLDADTQWHVSHGDVEDVSSMLRFLRSFWKILGPIRRLSPALRNTLQGYVWEIDTKVVGIIVLDRIAKTQNWQLSFLGVLPAFRERGIGTLLLDAGINLVRQKRGKMILAQLTGDNVIARNLYEERGFEVYDGNIEFDYMQADPPPAPPIAEDYILSPLGYFAWEPRYELTKRIMPPHVFQYEPISAEMFQRPYLQYGLRWIWLRLQGITETEFAILYGGRIVARGGYAIRSRWRDISEVALRVDPAHTQIAPYLISFLVQDAQRRGRRRRVEMSIPIWQPHLLDLVTQMGFHQHDSYYMLGILL